MREEFLPRSNSVSFIVISPDRELSCWLAFSLTQWGGGGPGGLSARGKGSSGEGEGLRRGGHKLQNWRQACGEDSSGLRLRFATQRFRRLCVRLCGSGSTGKLQFPKGWQKRRAAAVYYRFLLRLLSILPYSQSFVFKMIIQLCFFKFKVLKVKLMVRSNQWLPLTICNMD